MKMSKVEFDCGKWLQEAEEFALPNWSALPSIPLYMDQVMMFTGEALSLFERDEKQSLCEKLRCGSSRAQKVQQGASF